MASGLEPYITSPFAQSEAHPLPQGDTMHTALFM